MPSSTEQSHTSEGAVIYPVRAVAAATSGLARYNEASSVPPRPLKLRFEVRSETPCVAGACPMPTQGPQPHSSTRAPLSTSLPMTPSRSSSLNICRLPGATTKLTSSWAILPSSILAALTKSV